MDRKAVDDLPQSAYIRARTSPVLAIQAVSKNPLFDSRRLTVFVDEWDIDKGHIEYTV